MLSALYAKKHYGNIHLYTTEMEAEQINKIGVPYTSINTELLKWINKQDLITNIEKSVNNQINKLKNTDVKF